MYMVVLPNFSNIIYEGESYEVAKAKILNAGFEAIIYKNDELFSFYSPISGWKHWIPNQSFSVAGEASAL